MVRIPFLLIALFLLIIWAGYRTMIYRRSKYFTPMREILVTIFFIYFLAIIYFTIFKRGELHIVFNNRAYANLAPLRETIRMFIEPRASIRFALLNVFGNILLFIPLGFLIPLLFDKGNNLGRVVFYGALSSALIEVIQFFTTFNVTDIDDVIFNTAGAFIGIMCYRLFYSLLKAINLSSPFEKIKNYRDNNLIKLAAKPLSVMLLSCVALGVFFLYKDTYSGKLTNEALAKEVFSSFDHDKIVLTNEIDKHKFFLKEHGSHLEFSRLDKVMGNRYAAITNYQASWKTSNFGFSVTFVEDYRTNSHRIIVFGRNNSAKSVLISYKGNDFKQGLMENEYFIIPFPAIIKFDERTDMYNIYNDKPSKDLQIRFLDGQGEEYRDMMFLR
jgi:glycopeptide antibiotics resistance protein